MTCTVAPEAMVQRVDPVRNICALGSRARTRDDDAMVTEDAVLKALDNPRKVYAILQATDPGGSTDALQALLTTMRDEGKLRFDINKGNWRKA